MTGGDIWGVPAGQVVNSVVALTDGAVLATVPTRPGTTMSDASGTGGELLDLPPGTGFGIINNGVRH